MTHPVKSAAALAWLGLALLGACHAKPPPTPDIRPVRTVVATARPEGEPVSLTGHIRARTEESVAFRVDGRMIARRVDVGQQVQPGQVVAELDPQNEQNAVQAAEAKLAAAQAVLMQARNDYARQQVLVRQGWSTHVQFDAAEQAFHSAEANVDAAGALLRIAKDLLDYTQLRADSAGSVTATGAEAGEVVHAGQMIVTVAHDDGADAVFDVPASLMRQVSRDAVIDISLTDDPSVRATGQVREVAPQADPVTQSFRVKVGLAGWPKAMRLGATVTGQTRLLATDGIELPATVLTAADDRPAVWVVDPATQEVSLRPVGLRQQGSSTIVVVDGLKGGELVVSAGVHALRPVEKVPLAGAAP
ncbi:MAG: efflux RND transporter periplasmic adaptor subunit [Rhodopila sp.]|nr:efflux RND transporter periplasmic adaptor subunit [Rhodopila sp.]